MNEVVSFYKWMRKNGSEKIYLLRAEDLQIFGFALGFELDGSKKKFKKERKDRKRKKKEFDFYGQPFWMT